MARRHDRGWAPYIPVAQRQQKARRKIAELTRKGRDCHPVTIKGRTIARSFWGKAWCDNLESYSDHANRLPRGRTYARNGCVIDLQIEPGKVKALVSGSDIYSVEIGVKPLPTEQWKAIIKQCSGSIASLIELLQGRLSPAVMETVTRHADGLFPLPHQISLRCSCPDGASMCKHVAAVLYGIGARLDDEPELLFCLRNVQPQELIAQAGTVSPADSPDPQDALAGADLSALFGIDLDDASPPEPLPELPEPSASKAAASVSQTAGKAAPRRTRNRTVSASDLIARGIPRHMIQSWLDSDVLLRTERRGLYRTTAQTETRIQSWLSRRRS